jgi:hypothetical protein
MASMSDPVNHPSHYSSSYIHPKCGKPIECIDVVRHMGFDLGNVIKYLWRAGKKNSLLEDLKKARWYLDDWISAVEADLDAAEVAELDEKAKGELLEKLGPPPAVFPAPDVFGKTITIPCAADVLAPWSECTVRFFDDFPIYNIVVLDAGTATTGWYAWNHAPFYLGLSINERQRGRDELLGLISKLPADEYGKLSGHIQETVEDWISAQGMKSGGL